MSSRKPTDGRQVRTPGGGRATGAPDADAAKPRTATVVDVASSAGVAIGTVSRYLNGHTVRRANRDQIEQAIAALGYRRNAVASAMKTNVTHMVGFMVPTLSEFHAGLLEQLSRRMRRTGRAVVSYCHEDDPRAITEGLEFFASHRVDALVMDGGSLAHDTLMRLVDSGLIVVLYDNDVEDVPADRVFVDNRKASARAVNHLLDLGHERIGVIHGNLENSAGVLRLAGYRDALKAHGIPVDPALIIDGHWSEAGGYAGARELFALDDPPTAVFGSNYNITIGLLTWVREHGMRVPGDLSVVSFDDVPAFTMHEPGITAVGQPVGKLADTITTLLGARLASPDAMGRRTVLVDCDIILRGSTRRLARLRPVGKTGS